MGQKRTGARPAYAPQRLLAYFRPWLVILLGLGIMLIVVLFLAGCGSDIPPSEDSGTTLPPIELPTPFPTAEPLRERLPTIPALETPVEACLFEGDHTLYGDGGEAFGPVQWNCSGELHYSGQPTSKPVWGDISLPPGGYVLSDIGCAVSLPSGGEFTSGEFENTRDSSAALVCESAPENGALVLRARRGQ